MAAHVASLVDFRGPAPRDFTRVRALIARRLQVGREDARGFVATTADGHSVFVEQARGGAAEWLVLRAKICVQRDMDPALALERNGKLAFAVMVLVGGSYWLRVAVPMDSTELDDPAQLVELVADGARSLCPHQQPAPDATEAFQHYTE